MSGLPDILRVANKAGGPQAVLGLVKAFGGKFMDIPKRVGPDHPLVRAGGQAAADAIVREFGPSRMIFPKGRQQIAARVIAAETLANGGSLNDAVEASKLSGRVVSRIRADMKAGRPIFKGGFTVERKARKRDPRQIDIEDFLAIE